MRCVERGREGSGEEGGGGRKDLLTVTVSWLKIPLTAPLPYWMEKAVPLALYVLDLELSYLWWMTGVGVEAIL